MMPRRRGTPIYLDQIFPNVVDTLARNPHVRDSLPIGASLVDWAVMGA